MAVLEGGVSGVLCGVGVEAANALHVVQKPIPHGALGHYRTSIKLNMAIAQGANSRLFELRNTGSNVIVLTSCRVCFMPTGTVTVPYAAELAFFRLTNFTAVDTTGTVTPTSSTRRTAGMAAYPGGAAVRHATVAGVVGGMTGGTLTKDANAIASSIAYAATASATTIPIWWEFAEDMNGGHPGVFAQNEGFEIENVVVGSITANTIQVVIDASWAEVTAY